MGKDKLHEISEESMLEVCLMLLMHYEKEISKIPNEVWENLSKHLPRDFKTSLQIMQKYIQGECSSEESSAWRSAFENVLTHRMSSDAIVIHAYLRGKYMGYESVTDSLEKDILSYLYHQGTLQQWFPVDFLVNSIMLYE